MDHAERAPARNWRVDMLVEEVGPGRLGKPIYIPVLQRTDILVNCWVLVEENLELGSGFSDG